MPRNIRHSSQDICVREVLSDGRILKVQRVSYRPMKYVVYLVGRYEFDEPEYIDRDCPTLEKARQYVADILKADVCETD